MFHGNGGNLGHRIPLARVFFSKMRCNVLMMCYRGLVLMLVRSAIVLTISVRYGLSEGSPSEKGMQYEPTYVTALNLESSGIKIDAQTGLEYISSHPVLSRTAIVRPLDI